MAYRDDIAALGADHHWDFDGDSLDQIGSANGTDSSITYSAVPIALDSTLVAVVNALTDRCTIATTTDINNSAQTRKAVCGWFRTTAFQQPPTRIYGEGDNVTVFQLCMGFGNQLIFEVAEPTNFPEGLQVYGPAIVPARNYHFCMIFLGSAQGNEIKLFVDGIEQFDASPVDRQPDTASLDARGIATFGDPSGNSGLGGEVVLQQAARNARYSHWATWGDEADADLTDAEIRETLFERGALADAVVSSGTESAMQTALDALPTAQPNSALNVDIEALSGDGDLTLTTDLTFDELSSLHFRYLGTDTLTLVNVSGGNATIVSAPFGGTLILATRQTLRITVLDSVTGNPIANARVLIQADAGGDLAEGTSIMNTATNGSGVATTSFDYTTDQPVVSRVRQGSTAPFYKASPVVSILTSTPLDTTVLMAADE